MTYDFEPSGYRIHVTGGAEFIGSHLVDALVEDDEVRVLDDFSTGHRSQVADDAVVFEGDVCDKETRGAVGCKYVSSPVEVDGQQTQCHDLGEERLAAVDLRAGLDVECIVDLARHRAPDG